ncbi:MAG: nucleotidyl transferase AbiEii/AbiGii toxin family protein [Deltaproteobacteria bacterium]|jgi:predicted nucleotidyltransferase component of viral defense system|nr:nucleotidyl transferase AbiEii/AbiGii toxin family protein [Deltaproteobacteria bacterium]
MLYVTGLHALSLTCSLDAVGVFDIVDWHNITLRESNESLLGDFAIELDQTIPEHSETFAVANNIRACLDYIESGDLNFIRYFKKDFIADDTSNMLIFEKVWLFRNLPRWTQIDELMGSEYLMEWLRFKAMMGHVPTILPSDDFNLIDKQKHKKVMSSFVTFLNCASQEYILTGSSALSLCYNLDRFVKNVYLSTVFTENNKPALDLQSIIKEFSQDHDYEFSAFKRTGTIDLYFINYEAGHTPLKIESTYRPLLNFIHRMVKKRDILVFDIESLFTQKLASLSDYNTIRDLYDLFFIVNNYLDYLPLANILILVDLLKYKGDSYLEYILHTQSDPYLSAEQLMNSYLLMQKTLQRLPQKMSNNNPRFSEVK